MNRRTRRQAAREIAQRRKLKGAAKQTFVRETAKELRKIGEPHEEVSPVKNVDKAVRRRKSGLYEVRRALP
ncbi:MAG: hypothetical protein ACRD2A_05250 [Vicinamibacterales bacterium]